MKTKKVFTLIAGICGIISGILIIMFSVADKPFPTPLWIIFSGSCLANGIINYLNGAKRK